MPGLRLDVALIRRFPGLSRRKAQAAVEKGQVQVDGRTVREPGAPVTEGARIDFDPNRPARPRARLGLPLLHQDQRLLIVDKPAGLLSVPTHAGSEEDTVERRVAAYAERLRPRHGYARAVHRLDRDTSGALAVALDPGAREALRALFRAHAVTRRYLALVAGRPRGETGTIELAISDAYIGGRRAVARDGEPGKPARTRYRVREGFPDAALLEIELDTGRQHQIRLHLAHVGLPILGDLVYGSRVRPPLAVARQMLHAHVLGFAHPDGGPPVLVESPLPEDLQGALARLRALTRSGARRGSRARPRGC